MHMNTKKHFWALALATPLLLSACGPSGDDPVDSSPAGKYVGVWDIPCVADGSSSVSGEATLNKSNDNLVSGSLTWRSFANASCSGAPSATETLPASLTIHGTGSVSGKTVDKVTATLGNDAEKDIHYVEGDRWFESPEGSPVDAEGFPTTLDMSRASVRR